MYKKQSWKEISQSSGYKSLKKSLNKDLKNAGEHFKRHGHYFRSKKEYLKKFKYNVTYTYLVLLFPFMLLAYRLFIND